MRRYPIAIVLSLSLIASVVGASSTIECGPEAVLRDVRSTLIGSIEISTLKVSWSTASEGPDIDHYELWWRNGARAELMLVIQPEWGCPAQSRRQVFTSYKPGGSYVLEIHSRDTTLRGARVPIVH